MISPAPVFEPLRRFDLPPPIPLVRTKIDVRICGGLAVVTTERLFRNAEATSIEATLTFSVPIHATLVRLTARVGDRELVAVALARDAARQTYEEAIDRGKTAVLHEEVLRGVHQLCVGHVPPGGEVAVRSTWIGRSICSLRAGNRARFRECWPAGAWSIRRRSAISSQCCACRSAETSTARRSPSMEGPAHDLGSGSVSADALPVGL